jgi:hypothetical protein
MPRILSPRNRLALLAGLLFGVAGPGHAQDGRDLRQVPAVAIPAFEPGAGPTVWIDEGHNDMHTAEGTYWPLAEMLRRDGFVVEGWASSFEDDLPGPRDVLIISNALHDRNKEDWSLPNPSAFSGVEIERLVEWVRGGGGLLLIADHMPLAGAAADLGAALGFEFRNGFAVDTAGADESGTWAPWTGASTLTFRAADGSLADHPIRAGRQGTGSSVDSVVTYTGQAFRSPPAADPLYLLPATTISLEPQTSWEFDGETTDVTDVGGWHQGAALEFGEGRVVVFGEAAQFRALGDLQNLKGPNGTFARNVIEWLAGVL